MKGSFFDPTERRFAVVCWKWKSSVPYRSHFRAGHVNILRAMVDRNLKIPHSFVCITDDPSGIDPRIRTVPIWEDFGRIPSPHGPASPSCYRRLRAFLPDMKEMLADRFVSIDLDCVITDDITPLLSNPAPIVFWRGQQRPNPYQGSMWMMDAGCRSEVYTRFDPIESPRLARQAGYVGSDQAWFAYCLGRKEAVWKEKDGVFSYRNDIRPNRGKLPPQARIVFFHGKVDPWSREANVQAPWIKKFYHDKDQVL